MILLCVGGECRVEAPGVIIITVSEGAEVLEFLDTAWVTPGTFVGAVDLARSWKRGTLRAMDILATDEREQTRVLTASGRMTFAGPYEADFADLASGAFKGRSSATQRAMFNFSGRSGCGTGRLRDSVAERPGYAAGALS